MAIRVGDLRDQIGMSRPRPFLWCRTCGNEASANRGDYFMRPWGEVFTCCGRPMVLARRGENVEVRA